MLNLSPLALIVAGLCGAVAFLFDSGTVLAVVIGLVVLVLLAAPLTLARR